MQQRDRPRERALDILREAERGVFADHLLDKARADLNGRDRAFLLELVYGVLRNRSRIDWLLDRYSAQPVAATDEWTRNILRLAAYQLLFLDKVPPSAAVNTATELAKRRGKKSGYVNGLLRTLSRNSGNLPLPDGKDPVDRLAVLHSHPQWLVRRWVGRMGLDRTEAVLARNNRPAPLSIRTNMLKGSREDLIARLGEEGAAVRPTRCSPAGIEVLSSPGLTSLPSFREGRFLVQDEAAQLVGLLLAPRPGETVLDACAAPGGKATHLAEQMQDRGTVVALEQDRSRMSRIAENAGRLGISSMTILQGDAASFREGSYDRILIDAPCSGLGVLRRHPDGRWTKNESTLQEKKRLQTGILANCASLVRPGGLMVYATCTTEPEENEEVISHFMGENGSKFSIEKPYFGQPGFPCELIDEGGFFRTFPADTDMDGFFAACLRRTS